MARRSRNSFAQTKRRLRHRAVIRRSDPFRQADAAEIDVACWRIAGNTEFADWSEWDRDRDRDCRVIGFETAEKAAEMQAWLDAHGIAARPLPRFGPTKEEAAALREAALKWGFTTGGAACRAGLPAQDAGGGRGAAGGVSGGAHGRALSAAARRGARHRHVPRRVGQENHREWFYGRREPAGETPSNNRSQSTSRNAGPEAVFSSPRSGEVPRRGGGGEES